MGIRTSIGKPDARLRGFVCLASRAGSRYIKDCGGMVIAQEPGSAAFNSMPVSVIQARLERI